MSETTALVKPAIQFINLRIGPRGFVWRNNVGAFRVTYKGKRRFVRFGRTGTPDIMGYGPDGRFIGVECKVGKREPTKLQAEFLDHAAKAGCIIGVAYNLDDVEDILRGAGL